MAKPAGKIAKKKTVEDYLSIDSRTMKKDGVFINGSAGAWEWPEHNSSVSHEFLNNTLLLSFVTSGGDEVIQPVQIDTTPCNYGNSRHWYICPGKDCGKRVAKLYLVGSEFLCRHCHNLNYLIQQSHKHHVFSINMQRIGSRLNWPNGTVPNYRRLCPPKHMHRKTFDLMVSRYEAYEKKLNNVLISQHNKHLSEIKDA